MYLGQRLVVQRECLGVEGDWCWEPWTVFDFFGFWGDGLMDWLRMFGREE